MAEDGGGAEESGICRNGTTAPKAATRHLSAALACVIVAPDTPKGNAAMKFKELAEKYTNDKVKVDVYANSTLYKDKEELEALQIGAVQMLAPSTSKFGPIGINMRVIAIWWGNADFNTPTSSLAFKRDDGTKDSTEASICRAEVIRHLRRHFSMRARWHRNEAPGCR